jgi:hypothetical protein
VGSFENLLLQNHWANLDQTWHKSSLGKGDFKFVQKKGIVPLQGEIIAKEGKCTEIFKKIFSRTSKPYSIKLGTNYLWVKGIQVCSNKGPSPLQRGDNNNKRCL